MTEPITTVAPNGDNNNNSEVENLKKQLSDAQKELGNIRSERDEATKYATEAASLIKVVAENEDIKERVRDAYNKAFGNHPMAPQPNSDQQDKGEKKKGNDDVPNKGSDNTNEKLSRIERTQRNQIIKNFEEKKGIYSLESEKQKEVKREVEKYLNTFGQSVETAPVEILETVMEKAYQAVDVDRAIKEGKLEGYAAAYTTAAGALPHLSGRRIEADREEGLTTAQKEWAEKLGVDPKEAAEAYKNKDNEYKTPSKAEKKG